MISYKLDNVYNLIREREGVTAREISEELGYSYHHVLEILGVLIKDKEVVRIPKSFNTRYYTTMYVENAWRKVNAVKA